MRWLAVCAALTGCPVLVHPDLHCPGGITGATIEEKLADAREHCAPMLRLRMKT